jgi:hypothetical protein
MSKKGNTKKTNNFDEDDNLYLYEDEEFFNNESEYESIVKDALKNGLGYSNPY